MGIKFASGGFLTTVQDMGRTGYQESGMSVSGVMDQRSAAIANILVGNDENEAVLEVTRAWTATMQSMPILPIPK